MSLKARIIRLERRGDDGCPPAHVLPVVRIPGEIRYGQWDHWLAAHPCACGAIGCPERRIGLLGPEPAASADEWAAMVRAWRSHTPEALEAARASWWRRYTASAEA